MASCELCDATTKLSIWGRRTIYIMGCPDGGSERERGLGPKLVFNNIVDVAKMCLRGWCMALPTPIEFAFTLGYTVLH